MSCKCPVNRLISPARVSIPCLSSLTLALHSGSGEWGSGDDRRLLRALLKSGATEDFHVDWGRLVASRTAQQARRRWRLMLKCVMDAHDREFSQNLNQLVTTFVPHLLPAAAAPPKPVKAKKSKRQRDKEAASAAAAVADAEYPGMSGGMY